MGRKLKTGRSDRGELEERKGKEERGEGRSVTEHFELAYSSACVSRVNAYCQNSTTGRVALTLDAMVLLWFGWVKSKHDSGIRWRKKNSGDAWSVSN